MGHLHRSFPPRRTSLCNSWTISAVLLLAVADQRADELPSRLREGEGPFLLTGGRRGKASANKTTATKTREEPVFLQSLSFHPSRREESLLLGTPRLVRPPRHDWGSRRHCGRRPDAMGPRTRRDCPSPQMDAAECRGGEEKEEEKLLRKWPLFLS